MENVEIIEGMRVVGFGDRAELRDWLRDNHRSSKGVWIRLAKSDSGMPSVSFKDVLEEGLCFGWTETTRRSGGPMTYLQRFAPRRTRGTSSQRSLKLAQKLHAAGLMTAAGRDALGLSKLSA